MDFPPPTPHAPRPARSRPFRPLLLLGALLLAAASHADTLVRFGTITQIAGAADLDLDGDILYAINFSADDGPRTIRGVTFLPDSRPIPGATLVGPQQVTGWQTRPEFGAGTDDQQLEELLHDIRWANADASERLAATLAVTPGEEYQLQILISGNTSENRRWDIRVAGRDAVDEITSLGASTGQRYARNRATLYSCRFTASGPTAVILMGDLFGRNDGGDRNPIWQALTLERVSIPPSPDDVLLDPTHFFPTHQGPIGRLQVSDRKFGATHTFAFASGTGDADNARFALVGPDLFPGPHDFTADPPGTTYSVRIRVVDAADPTRVLERPIELTLAEPHPPTAIVLDVASVSTLASPTSLVARITVLDPDPFDRHHLEWVAGPGDTDNAGFLILGNELRLVRAPGVPPAVVSLRLRATDRSGLAWEETFTLPWAPPSLRLNELFAAGHPPGQNAADDAGDWIELLNERPHYVDLAGWALSDDRDDPGRWRFPPVTLAPGGFLVVGAGADTGAGGVPPALVAGFSLSADGEWLGLTPPGSTQPASVLEFPRQFPGIAYGIGADGRPGYLSRPTPGAANGPALATGENAVHFSVARGFFSQAFTLELTADLPGSVIRYSLDGTAPAHDRGTLYSGPLRITPSTTGTTRGARIVRAVALHPEAAHAPIATQTYLFVEGVSGPTLDGVLGQSRLVTSITRHPTYGPSLAEALLALPALSVVMAAGPTTTEQAASLELLDPARSEPGFQIPCGIVATGTTSLGSPKLSLSARFRAAYGRSTLQYPVFATGSLFPDGAATEFNELRLRSHSHDTFYWLGTRENPPVPYGNPPVRRSGDAQLTRNPWIDERQLAMGQPGKRGRQVHLYLNGAYHGIYHVHEHVDEDFMASYFPGGPTDFHFTVGATSGSEHADGTTWRTPWNALKASLNDFTQARRWIDVTNLCDYMILSFYAGNDWDWTTQHNWAAAGPTQPDRGGWKFFAQDSDICLQDVDADCTDQDVPDGIFTALMRFPEFRVLFRDRVYRHAFNDGILTPHRAAAAYDVRMLEIQQAILAETARWQPSSSVGTLPWGRDEEWANEWRYLRDTFFPRRTDRLLQQIRNRPGWWPVSPPAFNLPPGPVPAGTEITFAPLTPAPDAIYFTTTGADPRLPDGAVHPDAQAVGTAAVPEILIPTRSIWRYLDNGAEPSPDWTAPGFDDAHWPSGRTEIGYGDGDETTVARFIDTDPATAGVQKNLTTYFRRSFNLGTLDNLQHLRIRLVRDDGAAAFINGREVWRTNLPEGPLTPATAALTAIGGTDESTFLQVDIDPASLDLRPTGNVLAIEVHQQSPTSSDISFEAEFLALRGAAGPRQGVVIDRPLRILARALSGAEWSALVEGYFLPEGLPPASATNLVLTEIHYHPLDAPDTEFLEFLNTASTPIDLSHVSLAGGVTFRIPPATVLPAGARLVLARDPAAFAARYTEPTSPYARPQVRPLGPWSGALSNAGETLRVLAPDGTLLFACTYGTDDLWPRRADGRGSSLELVAPPAVPPGADARSAWLDTPTHWRPSAEFHGSPGEPGAGPDRRIVLNELLPAPAAGEEEAIELLHPGDTPIDLRGWFLSDSADDFRRFRFPDGWILQPGDHAVLRESQYNPPQDPPGTTGFGLSSAGDELYLVEATPAGDLLRFVDHVEFGPLPRGVALGRFPNGTGPWTWLVEPTLGAPNTVPIPGYDAWSATAFDPGTPPERRIPLADPDGDGRANAAEFAFAFSPEIPDPEPPLHVERGASPDDVRVTYRIRTAATGLTYRLQRSADLRTWEEAGEEAQEIHQDPQPDGSTRVTLRLRSAPSGDHPVEARFLRLRVEGLP